MIPEWIVKILESGGGWGAVVFVLLSTVIAETMYIRSMQAKADKVYGYRLAERDTLNKVLTDTAQVLAGIVKANEDRNDLTEEQADLIKEQAHAFELLKTTVLAQYDTIKDHNHTSALVIGAMAEAVRTLTSLVLENRVIATGHVLDVKTILGESTAAIKTAIDNAAKSVKDDMRSQLGIITEIQRKTAKRAPIK